MKIRENLLKNTVPRYSGKACVKGAIDQQEALGISLRSPMLRLLDNLLQLSDIALRCIFGGETSREGFVTLAHFRYAQHFLRTD